MTDKEQIIIDGVDVSECAFHYQNKEGKHLCFKGDVVAICDGDCSYGAIYLKEQLARLKEENERLKYNNDYQVGALERTIDDFRQKCDTLISQLDFEVQQKECIEQECEELKEWLQANQPTGICETCTATALLQNDKYRKALDEIEKVIKKINGEPILTFPDFLKKENYKLIMKQCNKGYAEILNIINKTKDTINET